MITCPECKKQTDYKNQTCPSCNAAIPETWREQYRIELSTYVFNYPPLISGMNYWLAVMCLIVVANFITLFVPGFAPVALVLYLFLLMTGVNVTNAFWQSAEALKHVYPITAQSLKAMIWLRILLYILTSVWSNSAHMPWVLLFIVPIEVFVVWYRDKIILNKFPSEYTKLAFINSGVYFINTIIMIINGLLHTRPQP